MQRKPRCNRAQLPLLYSPWRRPCRRRARPLSIQATIPDNLLAHSRRRGCSRCGLMAQQLSQLAIQMRHNSHCLFYGGLFNR